jgi:1-acyl-sn-glycerol-3-phosphate acyltransferase
MVSFAIRIFCRRVIINKPTLLKEKGPLLLASNHPNSFLDSVIIDTLFEQPIWSLARGDVFKNKFATRILTAMKILPVYRTSEGVENLSTNYKTFDSCVELFRRDAIVMIFSEGKCINEWQLRPLKKGTARLAIKAWEENIPLKVLPVVSTIVHSGALERMCSSTSASPLQKKISISTRLKD